MSSPVMDLISTVPDDLPPRYGSDRSPTAIARVVSLIEGGRALNVSLYGGPPIQISATAVNWTGVETAHVLLDPDTGRALHALGPAPKPENPLPKWEQLTAPTRSVREAVLIPQWAGTWDGTSWTRHGGGGAWQRNTGGPRLTGLATYGRQAEALGRITVTAATLTLRPHPMAVAWSAQIAAATYSDTGPVQAGATISVPVQVGAAVLTVDITRLAAQLLTPGTGLALVGQTYGGVQASGDSLSIRITYTSR